jgi:hypothetical protein
MTTTMRTWQLDTGFYGEICARNAVVVLVRANEAGYAHLAASEWYSWKIIEK